MDDVDRSLGAHHSDLGGRPGEYQVGPDATGVHHQVCPPVGLPGDHRDAGDGRLAERIQELGPVPDDPAVLLVHAREKPGHVDEREERDVEGVTEPDETRRLLGSGDVEGAGEHGGLVGDDSDAVAVETAQPDHDVLGPVLVDLEEFAFVEDRLDDVLHVVGLGGRVGDDCIQLVVDPVGPVGGGVVGRHLHVVLRQERHEIPDCLQRLFAVRVYEMGDTRLGGVGHGAAQLLHGHLLAGDRLYDVGTGDEHVRGLVDLEDEIGEGRGVDSATGAWAHDHGNLRNHSRRPDVSLEDPTIAIEGGDAFLDAGTAGVLEAYDRCPGFQGEVHHLADLVRDDLAE